jgi:hypothetical protein
LTLKEGREEVRKEEKKGKVNVVITPHTKTSKVLWKRLYLPV